LSKQAKKWVKKSLQNSNFKKLEESPYKPERCLNFMANNRSTIKK
jgi:hypothetical protein